MPKISKEQIQEIKQRPSAESVVPNLPSECAGSYQELGYYRHGVKRAECLMPYWDKINYFDLPGIDVDFHNRIADYKRIFKADDALTRLKMRLASKSFNAKLIITDKIAPETDELKSIFAIIKEIPGNLDFHGSPCYEEALRAFCKFELGGFFSYLSDIIGLDSFLSFKQACRDYTSCKNQNEISQRFITLKEGYSSFVDDVRACEDGKMSIGFGETDDAKVNFEDIYGELKNTEGDFNWIIKTLKSMPDNQDYESDWKDERGCFFNVSINPKHNPFAYETKSLRLYHYCAGCQAPDEIEELINDLADLWDDMFTLLDKKFNFLDNEVEAARSAFETFMDFIGDADEYTPGDIACEVIRKTNIQNVETAMTAIAKTLDKSHAKKTTRQNNAGTFQSHLPGPKESSIRANGKTTAENNDRPLNIDDACHRLYEEEMESRKKRWLKFRDLLIEAGLVIPIEEWPMPTDWGSKNVNLIYAHLHEQINWSLDKIKNSSNPMTPQDDWESSLPDVLSFDLGHFAFRPMETYDDGIYRTITLIDGSAINISKSSDSSYITYPPRDQCVATLEEYIREGVRISKLINSTSNRTWRKAEAKFQKHRTLINLPTSYHAMKELGELLHDARIELTLDIEDYAVQQPSTKSNPTEEVIIEKIAAKLREEPIKAIVDGYTPKGKKESVLIANTKLNEKGFFSDPNLCLLFGVSQNTPYNWRIGKAKAPDGFAEAWEKKDEKAMRCIAEKYKANRGKTDVMNKKDRVSGLSDEEMYKMGAKMPNGNIGNPQ